MLHRLVIDDLHIAESRGLSRSFHPTLKHPASPVISPEEPWELRTGREGVSTPAVIWDPDEGIYKMWYWSVVGGLHDCYATSQDGVRWDKPSLNVKEFEGSADNNLVETPGRLGPGSIMFLPDAPLGPESRYMMVSWVPSPTLGQRYMPLFSADGFHWRTLADADDEPGISGPGVGDTGTCCLASDRFPREPDQPGVFLAFPRAGCKVGRFGRRAVGFTYCDAVPNFNRLMADWPHPVLALAPDLIDDEMAHERLAIAYEQGVTHYDEPADHHCEFYSMQVWRCGDVFMGSVWIFDVSMNTDRLGAWNQHGIMETQLAYSRDCVHWERLGDRQPWIGRGEPGSVDDAMIHFNCAPVRVGDELFVYYSAGNLPHPTIDLRWMTEQAKRVLAGERHATQHVGLTTCRPDGFISLDAPGSGGRLRTRPFEWQGERLLLNVDATGGEAAVRVLDEAGRTIKSMDKPGVLSGDHIDGQVNIDGLDPVALNGRKVCLEIKLKSAKLYSYQIQ